MSTEFSAETELRSAVERLPANSLKPLRQSALTGFLKTGFPGVKQEDWRYTNLQAAVTLSQRWLSADRGSIKKLPDSAASVLQQLQEQIEADWIVVASGQAFLDGSTISDADISVRLLSTDPQAAEQINTADPLSSFNAALMTDGLVIRIASNSVIKRPVAILLFDDSDTAAALSNARIVIDAGVNSSCQLLEIHRSHGAAEQFSNTVSQVNLQAGSTVALTRIQDREAHHLHTGRVAARIGADASFNITSIDIGGALIRNDVAIDLAEAGADVTMNGLYLASDNQHIDNHTRVDHRVGPSTSSEEYRGLLNGNARCVFNGKAVVHIGADGSDAQQSNHNLLMSDKAEIDTKPELEIYADEVKCSHGATVGQLDPVSLFYLRSRGLDKDQATRILTSAFATKIIEESPVAAAHDYLQQRSKACLERIIAGDSK